MAQIFPKTIGFWFKLSVIGLLIAFVAWVFLWRWVMAYPIPTHDAAEQPVPFSHKHHVGDDGIACRYCHTSVEDSAFAGIPPLTTCMTCHSQLYTDQKVLAPLMTAFQTGVPLHWKRLYKLPDFVYFRHDIHIHKGVGCVECHGPVDQMPLLSRNEHLTMGWCLSCHRAPQKHLRPQSKIYDLHWQARDQRALGAQLMRTYHIDQRRLSECSTCHR